MGFRLTEDQEQLRESVERFVREQYGVEAWRAAARQEPGFREDHWRTMADLGWLAAALPEEYGGLGLGPRERSVIMESLGRGLALEPFWSTAVLGAELVIATATPAQKQDFLPRIADGSLRLAFALAESGSRYQWTDVRCRAERHGDGYRITGHKIAVLDAASAHRLLVLARTAGEDAAPGGLSLFWVDGRAKGVERRDFLTLDERRCSDIRFDAMEVSRSQLLGAEGQAAGAVEQAMDHAMAALCAEAVGAMSAVLQTTVEYLKTRKQFGKNLSEFQALRHRVADMVIATEQSRSISAMSAMCLNGDVMQRKRIVAAAKVQIGNAGRFVGESAVQLHGGIGISDDLHVGHYLKRLMVINLLLGDASFHLKRFADLDGSAARSIDRSLIERERKLVELAG